MPLYEFICASCNRRFEKLCRQNTVSDMECPQCGKSARRVFSTFQTAKKGSDEIGSGSSCGSCSSSRCSSC